MFSNKQIFYLNILFIYFYKMFFSHYGFKDFQKLVYCTTLFSYSATEFTKLTKYYLIKNILKIFLFLLLKFFEFISQLL